jgi:hypothetical protein
MNKVLVRIKKREIVEYYFSGYIEVSDTEVSQIRERPLQSKYWAEHVVPYRTKDADWHAIDDGRKSVSFEAIEVLIEPDQLRSPGSHDLHESGET